MKKPKKSIGLESLGGMVFSTDPKAKQRFDEANADHSVDLDPTDQDLRIWLDKKNRKGKAVTLIKGFECSEESLKVLAKKLKSACGVGGSAKDGEIFVQGDHRQKVLALLKNEGYNAKLAGG